MASYRKEGQKVYHREYKNSTQAGGMQDFSFVIDTNFVPKYEGTSILI